MSGSECPPAPADPTPSKYASPKAAVVSEFMTRWPGQVFTSNDIIAIGYAEELAKLEAAESAAAVPPSRFRTQARGLMARAALQRYIEGDGFYLQEGDILEVYDTAATKSQGTSVWRATPMAYPAGPGLQTTDDLLIAWNAPKRPRSKPLLRESVGQTRMKSLSELFARTVGRTLSFYDIAADLYPDKVGQTQDMAASNTKPAAQAVKQISGWIRSTLYGCDAHERLNQMLAERGLRLLVGQIFGNDPDHVEELHGVPQETLDKRVRVLFRAVSLTTIIPPHHEQYLGRLIQWRQFGAEAEQSSRRQ